MCGVSRQESSYGLSRGVGEPGDFYLRPGNSDSPDQPQRNHAVQYAAEPGFGWYRLRREWPSVYESHAELAMETWTKVRIEVAGRAADPEERIRRRRLMRDAVFE